MTCRPSYEQSYLMMVRVSQPAIDYSIISIVQVCTSARWTMYIVKLHPKRDKRDVVTLCYTDCLNADTDGSKCTVKYVHMLKNCKILECF